MGLISASPINIVQLEGLLASIVETPKIVGQTTQVCCFISSNFGELEATKRQIIPFKRNAKQFQNRKNSWTIVSVEERFAKSEVCTAVWYHRVIRNTVKTINCYVASDSRVHLYHVHSHSTVSKNLNSDLFHIILVIIWVCLIASVLQLLRC